MDIVIVLRCKPRKKERKKTNEMRVFVIIVFTYYPQRRTLCRRRKNLQTQFIINSLAKRVRTFVSVPRQRTCARILKTQRDTTWTSLVSYQHSLRRPAGPRCTNFSPRTSRRVREFTWSNIQIQNVRSQCFSRDNSTRKRFGTRCIMHDDNRHGERREQWNSVAVVYRVRTDTLLSNRSSPSQMW